MDLNAVEAMPPGGAQRLPCQEQRQFPANSACTVYIQHIDESGALWVMLESEFQIVEVISDALNLTDDSTRVINPAVNDVVSALNSDNTWYRAIILQTEPEIRARFIDFGDDQVISPAHLAPLPPTLTVLQPLAMKVQLPPDSKIVPVVGATLLVECVNSAEGVTIVDAVIPQSDNAEPDSTQCSYQNPDVVQAETVGNESKNPDEVQAETIGNESKNPDGVQAETIGNESKNPDEVQAETVGNESKTADPTQAQSDDLPSPKSSDNCMESTSAQAAEVSLPPNALVPSYSDSLFKCTSGEKVAASPVPETISEAMTISGNNIESTNNDQATIDSLPENPIVGSSSDCGTECIPSELAAAEGSSPALESACVKRAAVSCSSLSEVVLPAIGTSASGDAAQMGGGYSEHVLSSANLCPEPVQLVIGKTEKPMADTLEPVSFSSDAIAPSCTVGKGSFESSPAQNSGHVDSASTTDTVSRDSVRAVCITEANKSLIKGWLQGPNQNVSSVKRNSLQTCDLEAPMKNSVNALGSNNLQRSYTQEPVHDRDFEAPVKNSVNAMGGNNLQRGYTREPVRDQFTSALDRHPHAGGGYAPAVPSDMGGDQKYSYPQVASSQRSITKGRNTQNQQNSPNSRLLRGQDTPQSNSQPLPSKVSPQTSYPKPVPHQNMGSNSSQDFKTILEFELAIIREQNRLQMLQLQKKMEQNVASQVKTLKEEVSIIKQDMTKQLAAFRNEVNNRLLVINDSVIHKMADIYSDITMLKNDREMVRDPQSNLPCTSEASAVNSDQMFQYQNSHTVQPNYHPDGSSDVRQNLQVNSRITSNFTNNSQKQHSKHLGNTFDRKTDTDASARSNHLMSMRKEKMLERDHHQPESSDNHFDQQHTSFPVGQFDINNYPKMDYFDPSNTGQEKDESKSAKCPSSSIISVKNLDEKLNPDLVASLFGVYGNVQRVKMSLQDKGRAFIEMADSAQAEEAIRYLNNAPLMGQRLHVTPCSFERLNLSRQEFQSNTSKDFTKPNLQKMSRFYYFKWDAQKLHAPSNRLMISNVLSSVSDEKIKEQFAKRGFHILNLSTQLVSNDEKKLVFASFGSVEEAVNALTVMHLQEMSDWMMMRISFAKADKR